MMMLNPKSPFLWVLLCLSLMASCLRDPTVKKVDADSANLPPEQTFESTETNLEMISYNALKSKIMRVYNIDESSATITLMEDIDPVTQDSFKQLYSFNSQFTSSKFRAMVKIFNQACVDTNLTEIGLENAAQPSAYWKSLTGLNLTDDQLNTTVNVFTRPDLNTPFKRQIAICVSLAMQANVWLKR